MKSPLDASTLRQIREGLYEDASHGYLITDTAAVRSQYEGQIQQLNTREMKLATLGVFPLAEVSLPLLSRTLAYDGVNLTVPELFKSSQIPVFAGAGGKIAYIPAEGANICRYFHDLWKLDEGETDEVTAVISGFAVLASYAGL